MLCHANYQLHVLACYSQAAIPKLALELGGNADVRRFAAHGHAPALSQFFGRHRREADKVYEIYTTRASAMLLRLTKPC